MVLSVCDMTLRHPSCTQQWGNGLIAKHRRRASTIRPGPTLRHTYISLAVQSVDEQELRSCACAALPGAIHAVVPACASKL
jgi:hypothetical protein